MLGTSSFRLMTSLYVGMMTTFSLRPISAFTGAFSVKVMISPDVNRAFPFVNMVLPSFLSAVLSAELHGSITSSQFCQVNGWPGRTAILSLWRPIVQWAGEYGLRRYLHR